MELAEEGKYSTFGFNDETGVFEKAIISVEGITTDTEKDFSSEDMSSPIIFAQKTDYEEVVYTDEEGNEVTEQLEVQKTLKIEDEQYLYGGKNGWYYGIWKGSLSGSLYTVPFSESKLEEFKEGTENIQNGGVSQVTPLINRNGTITGVTTKASATPSA